MTEQPPTTAFADRLLAAVRRRGNPVCVGLDPRAAELPDSLRPKTDDPVELAVAYEQFSKEVIDAVAPLVAVVKPQMAFFEELGPAGLTALARVIGHARVRDLLVVLDGKRNDIGSTAEAYARGYLARGGAWQADALTVSPYLGGDSLRPFVDAAVANGAGVFVLVKTSNPGGADFQDLTAAGRAVYEHVAAHVEGLARETSTASGYGAVGAVVGATYPDQLAALRAAMPHAWLLVPGYGAQGGSARDVAGAFDAEGRGAIINSSRAIIFAHRRREYAGRPWQEAVAAATRDMIEELRDATPAGKLAALPK